MNRDSLMKILRTPKQKQLFGFTLVELIIVITILAILGTLGFVSIKGYASSARDSARVSDVATISKAIELTMVERGTAPMPFGSMSYTGGSITLQVGTASNSAIPKLSEGVADPLTKAPYNYSVIGEGLYYQLGASFENTISFNASVPGVPTAYANTNRQISKLIGNYYFDPTLPSLFPITGTVSTASGGIFSADGCFVLNNVASNSFTSTAATCVKKKDYAMNTSDTGLVGYWNMETLSGALVRDMSGNSNHGTLSTSGAILYSTGVINGSSGFDGISGNITVPYSAKLSFDFNQNFTVASWIRIPPTQVDVSNPYNYDTIMEKGSFSTPYSYSYMVRNQNHATDSGKLVVARWDGTNHPFIVSSKALNDNKYHSIVFMKNGNHLYLYIDGKLDGKTIDTTTSSMIQNTPLILGAGNFSATRFTGFIDDLKIYNRTLSDIEIKQQTKIAGL